MTGDTPPMPMPTMPTMPPTVAEQIFSLCEEALLADIPPTEILNGLISATNRLEASRQRALRLLHAVERKCNADHVDGLDRDDLGESQDY